jgi:hypothetical protein
MMWPTVSRHPFGAHDQNFLFPFSCRTITLLSALGHPLWREDGSVICSAICQWLESRRTHNHILLSHLRLLGSLFVVSYDSQGLRWKHSNSPPHWESRICCILMWLVQFNMGTFQELSGLAPRTNGEPNYVEIIVVRISSWLAKTSQLEAYRS